MDNGSYVLSGILFLFGLGLMFLGLSGRVTATMASVTAPQLLIPASANASANGGGSVGKSKFQIPTTYKGAR